MVIRQTREDSRDSFELTVHSTLEIMRLLNATVNGIALDVFHPEEDELHHSVKYRPLGGVVGQGFFIVQTEYSFRLTQKKVALRSGRKAKKSGQVQEVVAIDVTFESLYKVAPDFEPTDAHYQAFSTGQAVFSAWPYFREFVQSTVGRMTLPSQPVPFLILETEDDSPSPEQELLSVALPPPAKRRAKL